jgi:hypothetical protein
VFDSAKVFKIFYQGFLGGFLGVAEIILCNMHYICNTNMYPLTLGTLNYVAQTTATYTKVFQVKFEILISWL